MFVRIKKIKGNSYAYLVENSWNDKKARQKVKQYLGRVHEVEKVKDVPFEEFSKLTQEYKSIVSALMEWSLFQYGFTKDPLIQKKWIYDNGKIVGDPETFKITSGKNNVTLKINEGYMNEYTLKEILNIDITKQEQHVAGTKLAKVFVNAGISIPHDVFIELFQRVYI
ncbi:MAG: hypothetical protein WC254_02035 [Candidatus Woesearchaeota archaeon]|jgi:hypothetical protein